MAAMITVAILRGIPGNDTCAECNASHPDWASLNLGVLMCIECSSTHRNLGVHISKLRSLTMDGKVWEPTILELFRNLGNAYCNSVWENLLHLDDDRLFDWEDIMSSREENNDGEESEEVINQKGSVLAVGAEVNKGP